MPSRILKDPVFRGMMCRSCPSPCATREAGDSCALNRWTVQAASTATRAQPTPPTKQPPRPGDALSWAIHKLTGKRPCGQCSTRRSLMNEWGWKRCWQHRLQIAGWLAEEAKKRGHPITDSTALSLLTAAVREAFRL